MWQSTLHSYFTGIFKVHCMIHIHINMLSFFRQLPESGLVLMWKPVSRICVATNWTIVRAVSQQFYGDSAQFHARPLTLSGLDNVRMWIHWFQQWRCLYSACTSHHQPFPFVQSSTLYFFCLFSSSPFIFHLHACYSFVWMLCWGIVREISVMWQEIVWAFCFVYLNFDVRE